jgi:hypothetical protein
MLTQSSIKSFLLGDVLTLEMMAETVELEPIRSASPAQGGFVEREMTMPDNNNEFEIRLIYDRRTDGRYHIHSPSIPGLHLTGPDLDAIKVDIDPLVRELLLKNSGVVVDTIKWVPPLEEILDQIRQPPSPPHAPTPGETRVLVITGRAA